MKFTRLEDHTVRLDTMPCPAMASRAPFGMKVTPEEAMPGLSRKVASPPRTIVPEPAAKTMFGTS